MTTRPIPRRAGSLASLLEAHHAVTAVLAEELDEIGLPLGFYDVLVQLTESGSSGLRMADLARRVLLSKSGLTRLVDRMVEQGLVQRRPSPEDGRGFYVVATHQGRNALRRASPGHLRGIARHFTSLLTDDELRLITRTMNLVADSARFEPIEDLKRTQAG